MGSIARRLVPFTQLGAFEPFRNIDEFFNSFQMSPTFGEVEPRIKIDVSENDTAYTVKADTPGVAKEDIKVSVEGNTVTIEYEVKQEKEESEKVLRTERYVGHYMRSFSLAQDVDEATASAKYTDGVLTLTLPKKVAAAKKTLLIA